MAEHQSARYKTLAQGILDRINLLQLREGEKLPSLRQFSQQQQVSMTTAIRCYEHLEQLGAITAIPNKGFFVSFPLNQQAPQKFPHFVATTAKLEVEPALLNRLISQTFSEHSGTQQHPLSSGQLGPSLVDYKSLQVCFSRALRHCHFDTFLYSDPRGNLLLRQAICQHFATKGFSFNPEELMITNGCLDAVSIALEATTKPNDTIAISSPCYNGLLQLLTLMGRQIVEVPSTTTGLDLEQLHRLAEAKEIHACLLTANHQNPTGHQLANTQKQALATFAEQYSIPIIEDDIYAELTHSGPMPLPIKYWDHSGWVIWCSSASKSLSPGLRLGWVQAGRFHMELLKQRFIRTLGINQPVQLGLAEYINTGLYRKHLIKVNIELRRQIAEYQSFLRPLLPKGTYISSPSGGTVLWIQIANLNSESLLDSCQKKGINIRSGSQFSSRNLYQDCFRINAGWPLNNKIKEYLKKISADINQQLS